MKFEVLTMGRVGVDVYPLQTGVGLEQVQTFGKFLGGSPTNVAVAARRLGRRAAVITRTGRDPFGLFIHQALRRFEVDDRYVTSVEGLPTPVTFCEVFPPDNFPIYFYRWPKAPDLEIRAEDLDLDAIRAADVFWATATGLCQEPSRTATLTALASRGRTGITVLDLDFRGQFWDSADDARKWVGEALLKATVAVGNMDECEVAVGERSADNAAEALLSRGLDLAVVKQGADGAFGQWRGGPPVASPSVPVKVVNGLGAGDAFGGALCHGLLSGWALERVLRFASGAGALVASQLECADAMPAADDVEQLLLEQS